MPRDRAIDAAGSVPRMGKLTGIVVAPLVVLLIGCGDSSETVSSSPPVGSFVSTEDWDGEGSAFATPVAVKIREDYVGWTGPCNGYGAKSVRITPDRMDLAEATISSLPVGCAKLADEEQETDLMSFFQSRPHWSLEGNRLKLWTDSMEVVLRRGDVPMPVL